MVSGQWVTYRNHSGHQVLTGNDNTYMANLQVRNKKANLQVRNKKANRKVRNNKANLQVTQP
jgi:hypothetical protein